jgi:hypothetical protein
MGFGKDVNDALRQNWRDASAGRTDYLVPGSRGSGGCALILALIAAAVAWTLVI